MAVARNIKQAVGGVRGGMLQGNGRVIEGNAPYGPGSQLQGGGMTKSMLTGKMGIKNMARMQAARMKKIIKK